MKPVMKLSPPSPQEKRAFLASESFQDEGPIHLAVKAGREIRSFSSLFWWGYVCVSRPVTHFLTCNLCVIRMPKIMHINRRPTNKERLSSCLEKWAFAHRQTYCLVGI